MSQLLGYTITLDYEPVTGFTTKIIDNPHKILKVKEWLARNKTKSDSEGSDYMAKWLELKSSPDRINKINKGVMKKYTDRENKCK